MSDSIQPRCFNCNEPAGDVSAQTAQHQYVCVTPEEDCPTVSWKDENVEDEIELLDQAREAREHAYAPYSGFQVGAAIRCESGEVYKGCNVEVSGRNTSIHAEAFAVFNAVVSGEEEFLEIAVSCSDEGGHFPCALCMHTLSEFMTDVVVFTDEGNTYSEYSLNEEYGAAYRPGDH